MTLHIADENRVRTLTLDRPEALNAFNEALYDATADALLAAGRAELTEKRASRPAEPKPEPEAPAKPAGRGRKTNPA